jgi:hypothetical protein
VKKKIIVSAIPDDPPRNVIGNSNRDTDSEARNQHFIVLA